LRVVAIVVSAWIAWRWLGFFVGLLRVRRFEKGPLRREARRTVINRGAINVFFSVAAVYLWAVVYKVDFTEVFVGFLAALMMCSLAVGIASAFMQPEERNRETLEICRLRPMPGAKP
jgi:hypothetical protein